MRTSIIIILIGTFCQTAGAKFIVPAVIDRMSDWYVNVAVSSVNVTVRMRLSLTSADIIPFGYPAHLPDPVFSLFGRRNGVHLPFSFESDPLEDNYFLGAELGVGRESQFLAAAGSVSMIQLTQEGRAREGHLVIGSNFSSFNATCIPGSLMRSPGNLIRSEVTIRVGGVDHRFTGIDFWDLSSNSVLAYVPQSILEVIIRILEGMNVQRAYRPGERSYWNCTRELVIESLPELEVRSGEWGMFVLYPDDYIDFTEYGTHRLCSVLLRSSLEHFWSTPNSVQVNLLKLPNINVRVSNTGIVEFCDAMVDPDYVGLHSTVAHESSMTYVPYITYDSSDDSSVAEVSVSRTTSSSSALQHTIEPTVRPLPREPDNHTISAPAVPTRALLTESRLQRFAGQLRRFLGCLHRC
jgi:hypothetical protein